MNPANIYDIYPPTIKDTTGVERSTRLLFTGATSRGNPTLEYVMPPYLIVVFNSYTIISEYSFARAVNRPNDLAEWTLLKTDDSSVLPTILDAQTNATSFTIRSNTSLGLECTYPKPSWKSTGATPLQSIMNIYTNNPVVINAKAADVAIKAAPAARRAEAAAMGMDGGGAYIIRPNAPPTYPQAILVDNNVPITFSTYSFSTGGVSGQDPLTWTIQGSTDGINFHLLDDRTAKPQRDLVPDVRNAMIPPIPLNAKLVTAAVNLVQQQASSAQQQQASSAQQQLASAALLPHGGGTTRSQNRKKKQAHAKRKSIRKH
jgi:hypothetical protein